MGLATAQSNAAHMFANGQGTPQDYEQAQIYWGQAATEPADDGRYVQPRGSAPTGTGEVDLAAARRWFTDAADQGHGPAARALEALRI